MSRKKTTSEFVSDARSVHGDRYDYFDGEYVSAMTKIKIICRKHGHFWQRPNDHLGGKGCSLCGRENTIAKRTSSLHSFIAKAQQVHGNVYDYSRAVYAKARKKLEVICLTHGSFWVAPVNHLSAHSGCPVCAAKARGLANRQRLTGSTHDNFASTRAKRFANWLSSSREIHSDNYDYSKVRYKSNKDKVLIGCKKHGDFFTIPMKHIKGSGCPKCAGEERRLSQVDFIAKAIAVHGERYGYSRVVYKTGTDKVVIDCPEHGLFEQKPSKHLSGRGCPSCCESHGEKAIRVALENKGIGFRREVSFEECVNPETGKKLRFDFFIPRLKMCIEFDGEQHFHARKRGIFRDVDVEQIQKRDAIKDEFCRDVGIHLLRIPYSRIKSVEEILTAEIAA